MDDPNNELLKRELLENMNWTALLNDKKAHNNVKIILGGYFMTTSAVKANDELFLCYGWQHWYPDGIHTDDNAVYFSSDVIEQAKENSALLG